MSKPKMADEASDLSRRLREIRRQKNLTQTDLANLTDVSHVHIGRLEKGSSQPTIDVLKRLAVGLGVSVGYLVDGAVDHNSVSANLEDQELALQFQELSRLPQEDKAVIKSLVDAFLFRRQVQGLASGRTAPAVA